MKKLLLSLRRACVLAPIALILGSAQAAGLNVRFVVPETQVAALGIQLATLTSQGEHVSPRYPAHVVAPPDAEQVVSSPVNGLIAQLLVQLNQAVNAGDPLVRISSPDFGQLQLELIRAGSRAVLARQAAEREQQLFNEGIIPQRRMQEADANMKESAATLVQARAALRISGVPPATIDRIIASGNPEENLTLLASRAGLVAEISARIGQRVEAATPLLHVLSSETLWLDIQVPASESTLWSPGTAIKIADRGISARLVSAGSVVSTETQMIELRAEVPANAGRLRLGEAVTVEMPAAGAGAGWTLPLVAVAHNDNDAVVFVRTEDGFEAKLVRILASAGQQVRVEADLKPGDKVAVSGVVALKGAWLAKRESK